VPALDTSLIFSRMMFSLGDEAAVVPIGLQGADR
jgi:hypothetical protein